MSDPNSPSPQMQATIQQQIETPASSVGIYMLPTGVLDGETLLREVQMREISGIEEDLMLARSGTPNQKYNAVLRNCVTRIGSVVDKAQIGRMLMDMLSGDRSFLIVALRRASLGDKYPFDYKCEAEGCGARNTLQVDLAELEVFSAKDPAAKRVKHTFPSGRTAVLRVSDGHLEAENDGKVKVHQADARTRSLLTRLESIDGAPATLALAAGLSLRDRDSLRPVFEEIDGGVEMEVDVQCPVCGTESSIDVEVGSTGFFFPSVLKKRSKATSSS